MNFHSPKGMGRGCVSARVFAYVCACVRARLCVCVCVRMHVCVRLRMCARVCGCEFSDQGLPPPLNRLPHPPGGRCPLTSRAARSCGRRTRRPWLSPSTTTTSSSAVSLPATSSTRSSPPRRPSLRIGRKTLVARGWNSYSGVTQRHRLFNLRKCDPVRSQFAALGSAPTHAFPL